MDSLQIRMFALPSSLFGPYLPRTHLSRFTMGSDAETAEAARPGWPHPTGRTAAGNEQETDERFRTSLQAPARAEPAGRGSRWCAPGPSRAEGGSRSHAGRSARLAA